MELIDTHTHLYLPEFDNDRDEVVNLAAGNGILKLLMPNIDVHTVDLMLLTAQRYHGVCLPMMGLHPTSVKDDFSIQLDRLEGIFPEYNYIGIGEIGIDLYWDKSHLKEQLLAMKRQVAFAVEKRLPVAVHTRESFPEVFSVLHEFEGSGLSGVLHAFSGTLEDAREAVRLGFLLGIGGPVTFKNSRLVNIIKEIGAEHIVLETDSPYLAPVPHRGQRNESSYLRIINSKVAEVLEISEDECASIVYKNSSRLFKI